MECLRRKKKSSLRVNQALLLGSVKSKGRRGGVGVFHFQFAHLNQHFMQAVNAGRSEVVQEMLEKGDLHLEDIDMGNPALLCACYRGHLETVMVLLNFGAEPDVLGENGRAPIHEAARNGNMGTLALLLDQGVRVNLPSKFEKRTALHIAAASGKDKVVELLLNNGAHVDQADIYGASPMCKAAGNGWHSTVQLLLTSGADVNAYDKSGWTGLHMAAHAGHSEVVRVLLFNHAYVQVQNKYGRTPLHCACSQNHLEIVVLLLDFRADVNVRDAHGRKPVEYTMDLSIMQILKPLVLHDSELMHRPGIRSIGELVNIKPVI